MANNWETGVTVTDDYSIVEWLQVKSNFANAKGIVVNGPTPGTHIRNNLVYAITGAYGINSDDWDTRLYNNLAYGQWSEGIRLSGDAISYNNTVFGALTGFSSASGSCLVRNCISLGNSTANWGGSNWNNATSSNNVGTSGDNPPGSGDIFTTSQRIFTDTNATTINLLLKQSATPVINRGDSTGLSALYLRDIKDTIRQYGLWDVGANEYPGTPTVDTNSRSVGMSTAVLYNTGTATVYDAYTVNFSGVTIPDSIGAGDRLVLDVNGSAGGPETCYVYRRISATQVTVQNGITLAHSAQDYEFKRAYNTLQAWETARQGSLVSENRVEKAVVYHDGNLTTAVTVDGSTTDATHFIWISVDSLSRHTGRAGTGACLNLGGANGHPINLSDDWSVVEGLEITNWGSGYHGVAPKASNCIIRGNIIHNGPATTAGIRTDVGLGQRIYNNIIYDIPAGAGILSNNNGLYFLMYNNTIYKCLTGIEVSGTRTVQDTIKNNICIGNTTNYNLLSAAFEAYNAGESGNMPGGANSQTLTPFNSLVDTTTATLDLHIKYGSSAINAADSTGLSAMYRDDIDGIVRAEGLWDMGADEGGVHPMTWDGGGADNNWSTAANWYGNAVPGAGDTVYFNGISSKRSIIDAGFGGTVKRMEINSGFTDSVKLSRSLTVADTFVQAAGTFYGSTQRVNIGNLRLTGGIFTAPSDTLKLGMRGVTYNDTTLKITGGTFTHNNG
ncbi:MAG: hypothetical protein JNL74_10440, partial [Fibrobacteres bacterium]|nr:hypothetical protein [Fibrobacterota bacterium]